jgi:hypothetical protein
MTVIVVEGGPCGNVPFGVDFSERQHGRDAGVAGDFALLGAG